MRRLLAALLAAALANAALAAGLSAEVTRALQPYGEFRSHALWSWHPSGEELAIGRKADAGVALHRVEGAGAAPVAIPSAEPATFASHQPTHGEYLVVVVADPQGKRRLHRLEAGALVALSPEPEDVTAFAWNPAGDRIAYAGFEAGRTTFRTLDPRRDATERVVARVDGRWTELVFSPNGRRVALTQETSATESHLWFMDLATGTRRRVTRPDGKASYTYRMPAFSRDGRSLFALGNRGSDYTRLVMLPVEGGAERVLTAHRKFDVDAHAVSHDRGALAFVTNENGSHVLRFIDLVTLKEQPRPPLFDGVIGGLAWRPGKREVGFHITSARSAGDVFSYEPKTNQLTRWTNGNNPAVNTREFAEPRIVRWKGADGVEVTGLLYLPPARFTGKRPVIVDHRAGPGSQWRAGFLGRANYLVSELGMAIVRPNVRGSTGFGKAFAASGEGTGRENVPKDIAALLEWIDTRPELDTARTLVIGEGIAGQPDDETFMAAVLDFAARGR